MVAFLMLVVGEYLRGAHASTESAGQNRPKSPLLCRSRPGDGSDADAADHRDQNHFCDLLVPPCLLRHQYRHVWPDGWRSFCLFVQGAIQTGAAVLRLDGGDASLRFNDRSRHRRAIDAGDRRLAIAHLSRRVGGIRALSRLSVFLFGRCREPCANAQPLPDRKGLRSGSDWRRHGVRRGPCASEHDERAVSGFVDRCGHRPLPRSVSPAPESATFTNPLPAVPTCFATAAASS